MLYLRTDTVVGASFDHYGEFSEAEAQLLDALVEPGDVVLDVGANIGALAVPLAKRVGTEGMVIAFEPQRLVFQILGANAALNGLHQLVPHRIAIGSQPGSILVPRIDYAASKNYGALALGDWDTGERVPVKAIDELSLPRCELIKADVEGMELDVIRGAEQTIRRLRPYLYVENERVAQSAELLAKLFSLDYRAYWHKPKLFNPDNYFGETQNLFERMVSVNVLAVHESMPLPVEVGRPILSPDDNWRQA